MTENAKHRVTIARGDGIGPEIMEATLGILEAAGAPLEYDFIEIGREAFLAGHTSGIPPEAWATIRSNPVMLKSPITTPQGGGYKSLNVTLRKTLRLFANVRPCRSYAPYVETPHPSMDLVIVRENEEDLYAGIEHRQTREVYQTLKLVSRPGSEAIVRYAFEYARKHGRKKVTCLTKDNIMKLSDGIFHRVFDEIAPEYPELEAEHQIIDIGAAFIAARPERMDVVVAPNLYGDIVSDIAALVSGSVGLAGSANVGTDFAMFEAVHGSAPDIAGKDIANPSGLLKAAVLMLVHLNEATVATRVRNAWLTTVEQGIHTVDIYRNTLSSRRVGTAAFAEAVIANLGQIPKRLEPADYREGAIRVSLTPTAPEEKRLNGVDVFLDWDQNGRDPDALGQSLKQAAPPEWKLKMITNRGLKVYPDGPKEAFCTDHWRCRFLPEGDQAATHVGICALLQRLSAAGYDFIKTENLYTIGGDRGYSLAQGE